MKGFRAIEIAYRQPVDLSLSSHLHGTKKQQLLIGRHLLGTADTHTVQVVLMRGVEDCGVGGGEVVVALTHES